MIFHSNSFALENIRTFMSLKNEPNELMSQHVSNSIAFLGWIYQVVGTKRHVHEALVAAISL